MEACYPTSGFKFKLNLHKTKNSVLQPQQTHFKCSIATRDQWLRVWTEHSFGSSLEFCLHFQETHGPHEPCFTCPLVKNCPFHILYANSLFKRSLQVTFCMFTEHYSNLLMNKFLGLNQATLQKLRSELLIWIQKNKLRL